jgi:dTDP-4-dehydrorhamnose reductase
MKLVILGANGMMGSMLFYLAKKRNLSVQAISRSQFDVMKDNISKFDELITPTKEKVTVVNCIGCIPQKKYTPSEYKQINQEFPHSLSKYCELKGFYFIHLSTNCVYSGKCGDVLETDVPDADDIYGLTKLLGEPSYGLVIRSSIIGPERNSSSGLFSWYTQNKQEKVNGFLHQYWNGLTTLELSYFILEQLSESCIFSHVVHVHSELSVSKYELLCMIKEVFSISVTIDPIDCPLKYYTLKSTSIKARKSIKDQLDDLKHVYSDFMFNM